jgi:hypothetical protein
MDKGERMLVFNGVLVDWLPLDQLFKEHGYWFPDCVFLKYVTRPFFSHECLKYHKELFLTPDTDDSQLPLLNALSENDVSPTPM